MTRGSVEGQDRRQRQMCNRDRNESGSTQPPDPPMMLQPETLETRLREALEILDPDALNPRQAHEMLYQLKALLSAQDD